MIGITRGMGRESVCGGGGGCARVRAVGYVLISLMRACVCVFLGGFGKLHL